MKREMLSPLLPMAERVSHVFPDLERTLIQARMDPHPVEHVAKSLVVGFVTSLAFGASLISLAHVQGASNLLQLSLVITPASGVFGFLLYLKYPNMVARRRVKKLERDLPYALRHLLIEVESGMNLYEAMVSISEGYGEASREFRQIVKDMNSGVSEMEALEKAVMRNPSLKFRRSLWQMINTLKAGSDLSNTLASLVDAIMEDQMLAVEQYGEELNPYILVYLLGAIIAPSLGVSFLIIFATFTGGSVTTPMFYAILAGITGFQIVFLQVVRAKRPEVKT